MNGASLIQRKEGGWAVAYCVPTQYRDKFGKQRRIVRGRRTVDKQVTMRRKTAKLQKIQTYVDSVVKQEASQAFSELAAKHAW